MLVQILLQVAGEWSFTSMPFCPSLLEIRSRAQEEYGHPVTLFTKYSTIGFRTCQCAGLESVCLACGTLSSHFEL